MGDMADEAMELVYEGWAMTEPMSVEEAWDEYDRVSRWAEVSQSIHNARLPIAREALRAAILAEHQQQLPPCQVCWTISWEPIEDEESCAANHPHTAAVGSEHIHCAYCSLAEAVRKHQQQVEALESRWRMAELECEQLRRTLQMMRDRYSRVTYVHDVRAADADIRLILEGHDRRHAAALQPFLKGDDQ